MVQWFDSLRLKLELWEEQSEVVKAEALELRQTLLDWPATFLEYITDQEIEASKPAKPSYITE
ncbi:hypothetical protein KAR91_23470 [Candidatus Pacearchaeota archaeon]|nr:hypothetical protein [Candidatus Pacearchaeota archaeon]